MYPTPALWSTALALKLIELLDLISTIHERSPIVEQTAEDARARLAELIPRLGAFRNPPTLQMAPPFYPNPAPPPYPNPAPSSEPTEAAQPPEWVAEVLRDPSAPSTL